MVKFSRRSIGRQHLTLVQTTMPNMRPIVILLLHGFITIETGQVPVGLIHDASLNIPSGMTTTVNGTCDQCLCTLFTSSQFFSVNCFSENVTCQLHSASDQSKPFNWIIAIHASFYFLSLPTFGQMQATDTHNEGSTATTLSKYTDFTTCFTFALLSN